MQDTNVTFRQQVRLNSIKIKVAFGLADEAIHFVQPHQDSIQPITYDAERLLQWYNTAFRNDNSVAYHTLDWLILSPMGRMEPEVYSGYGPLRNLLAVPSYIFSEVLSSDRSTETTGYFANPIYRVTLSKYSIYTFCSLSIVMLGWCGFVLIFCWLKGKRVPNISQFAEIDFGAKCDYRIIEGMEETSLRTLWKGIRNAKTSDVQKKIQEKLIFVGAVPDGDNENAVILTTDGHQLQPLVEGMNYS